MELWLAEKHKLMTELNSIEDGHVETHMREHKVRALAITDELINLLQTSRDTRQLQTFDQAQHC